MLYFSDGADENSMSIQTAKLEKSINNELEQLGKDLR